MTNTDPEDDNPGEPYFRIEIDGDTALTTDQVRRTESGTFSFEIPTTDYPDVTGDVATTVTLVNQDTLFDDEIATWTGSVQFPERSFTTSTEVTFTPTASPTKTDSSTTSATLTAEPTSSPTEELVSTLLANPTSTPTAEPTPPSTSTQTATTTPRGPSTGTEWTVTVVEVIDGDTLKVEFPDGSVENVRLLGVDSPETGGGVSPDEFEGVPNNKDGQEWLGQWAEKASQFASDEITAEESVRIAVDEQADRRGGYGRLLVYLYHDDSEMLNKQLLQDGYARLYDSSFSKRDQFASLETAAQQDDVGVWAYDGETNTATSTPNLIADGSGSDIAVTTIQADASGNDHENLNEEYVGITNKGSGAVDMSGWILEDTADHEYHFPSGFILDAGESVTVYTGSGTDTDTTLYWGSESTIWNNGGDTVTIRNENGDVAVQKEYS